MTKLEFYEALHVIAAVIWVGGGFIMQLFALRAQAANAHTRSWFFRNTEWIGQRFFLPSSIVILITGFLMLGDLPYDLGDGWVLFGFIVIVLSAITGAGFLGPESGRIGKLVESEGFDSPEVTRRYARLLTISRIESLLLFLVVADMVAKPGA
jgi:uncharacterized membrane protein